MGEAGLYLYGITGAVAVEAVGDGPAEQGRTAAAPVAAVDAVAESRAVAEGELAGSPAVAEDAAAPPEFGSVSLGLIGLGDPPAEVRLLPLGGLAAVVSRAPGVPVVPKMAFLLAHDRVLTSLVRRYTVLPAAFGTVVPGAAALRAFVDRYRGPLLAEIRRLRGQVEAEVKALWVPGAVAREAGVGPADLRAAGSAPPSRRFELAVEVGQAVEATVHAWRQRYGPEICRRLAPYCVAYRVNQPLSVEVLLNAAFLVRREREPELARAVAALAKSHAGRLELRYVAPLPPYNFVEIRLPWRRQQRGG
ncbi:MAG: GvpL/GvpF family gas vesicle protein [Acetobacteraceae bacterium]|nr:GvpL/GvpF family gas vesicle protein [Acetobacteraceae bacterium]